MPATPWNIEVVQAAVDSASRDLSALTSLPQSHHYRGYAEDVRAVGDRYARLSNRLLRLEAELRHKKRLAAAKGDG